MDWSAIFAGIGLLSGAGTGILSWYANGQKAEIAAAKAVADKLRDDFVSFRVKVAEEYVTVHDLAEIKADIKSILAKVDSKQDRHA